MKEKLFINSGNIELEDVGGGLKRKILGYDNDIMMVYVEFEKRGIGSVHKHPHRQVSYVAKGKFEVQIANDKQVLKEGDCFYIPPNTEHGAVCLEEGILIDVFNPHREDFIKH